MLSLLMIGLAFFAVAVTPGPANISNAVVAMTHGRKVSLVYGVGLSFGLVFWGIIAATGMGAILQSSIYLLMMLKVVGGFYLLWLAWQSAHTAMADGIEKMGRAATVVSGKKWFMRGLLLNISNPKTVIAWMAALSVGLGVNDGIPTLIAGVAVCVLVGFMTNGMYSILFSINGVMRVYRSFSRWVNGVAAGLFALAGLGMIRSAFSRS